MALDEALMNATSEISTHYTNLVSLATRQTFGSLDITILSDAQGNVNASDVKVFMKNQGTDRFVFSYSVRYPLVDDNCRIQIHSRVTPVERMYAAFPMLLFLNASIAGALLQPLLESQDGLTGQAFASMDLGTTYPSATGSRAVSNEGIEREYP